MHTKNIPLIPDEKNERLMMSGKIPDDWKTPEEIKEEAWIQLRIKTAQDKIAQDPTLETPQYHIRSALKDLNVLRRQQCLRLAQHNNLKLMAATAEGQNKEWINRLYAIRDLLDTYSNNPEKIISSVSHTQPQTERSRL